MKKRELSYSGMRTEERKEGKYLRIYEKLER